MLSSISDLQITSGRAKLTSSNGLRYPKLNSSSSSSPGSVPRRKQSVGSIREHTNYLNSHCKETAMQIKQREDQRIARSCMREFLIQKLTNKFGPRLKRRIVKHVGILLGERRDGKVSAEDEEALEKAILNDGDDETILTGRESTCSSARGSARPQEPHINNNQNTSSHPPPLRMDKVSHRQAELTGRSDFPYSEEPPSVRGAQYLTPIPTGREWEAVQLYKTMMYDNQVESEKKKKSQLKKELASTLAEQVEEAQRLKERERQREKEFHEKMKRDYEEFKKATAESLLKKHEKEAETRKSWEQQMENKALAIKREKELEKIEAKIEAELLAQDEAEEERQLQEQRMQELEACMKQFAEGDEAMRKKMNRRKEQLAEEIRIAKEFHERADAYDRAKKEAFDARMDRIEKLFKWAHEGPLGQITDEDEIKFDQKVRAEHEEIEENWRLREEKEFREKRELQERLRKENKALLEDNERRALEARRNELELGKKIRVEAVKYEKSMLEKKRNDHKQRVSYGETLLNQMSRADSEPAMTPVEESMNRDILRTIMTDPLVNSRITHRLRMTSATPRTGRPGTSRDSFRETGSPGGSRCMTASLTLSRPVTGPHFSKFKHDYALNARPRVIT
mmetsp:Transcript_23023/g.33687  ORF Transcript_23023/g.33687 Transcript_23023/m.33687 type:complete len:626 (+) Transcript_23023:173-2050(+)|eukprot:CAMPEP_0185027208 /NCGR_PEP_ID=MMETSP1103-20130426/11977_1 /TAXON_ID=36769 /ORGANISM="Paraphysomonas bandaiensis, Strain Caron Lab Isolate" /LENGTH=625 /DNA_ID=CAMNT_0027561091 /DNA_START=102 /DNA_END=1979 /DNA_ORIENTATION=-